MSNNSAEEEILVYAEFDDNVNVGKYRSIHALGLDSNNPIVQMDDTFFSGKYEIPVGTYMFFEEDPAPHSNDLVFDKIPDKPMKYVYKTRKLLKMEHAFVTPKGDKVQDLNAQLPKDDFDAISFGSIQEGIERFKEVLSKNPKQNQHAESEIGLKVESNLNKAGNPQHELLRWLPLMEVTQFVDVFRQNVDVRVESSAFNIKQEAGVACSCFKCRK